MTRGSAAGCSWGEWRWASRPAWWAGPGARGRRGPTGPSMCGCSSPSARSGRPPTASSLSTSAASSTLASGSARTRRSLTSRGCDGTSRRSQSGAADGLHAGRVERPQHLHPARERSCRHPRPSAGAVRCGDAPWTRRRWPGWTSAWPKGRGVIIRRPRRAGPGPPADTCPPADRVDQSHGRAGWERTGPWRPRAGDRPGISDQAAPLRYE